jgi:argininosuccinate lyase
MMKLWGGNYGDEPDRAFWEFNRSFPFDRRLLAEEIEASRAYVRALGACRAIAEADATRLDAALGRILASARTEAGFLELDVEDVHSFVEARLKEQLGELAGQMHLGRSRNEQSVTALRLWVRSAIDALAAGAAALVKALADRGREGAATVMPGYTHARPAEPITFGHLAAGHAWALARDHERLREARRRVNVLPLGSGALAGTALPLDREALARDLGFESVSGNALDAVSDRDFAAEFVFACAQLQTHLSRLAEDLMRFSAPEHGFLTLPEAYTTGSSLMPQKKNPDALELVRGKTARVNGDLLRLLELMKGLPSGYQKDLQEDKEAVFDAADSVAASLPVVAGVVGGLVLHADAMRRAASGPEMMAAGLAVALARDGMPFRQAHTLVGALVAEAAASGRPLAVVAAAGLSARAPSVASRIPELLDAENSVSSKATPGGTAPSAVLASLDAAVGRVSTP